MTEQRETNIKSAFFFFFFSQLSKLSAGKIFLFIENNI